jgi:hypothetical protein
MWKMDGDAGHCLAGDTLPSDGGALPAVRGLPDIQVR